MSTQSMEIDVNKINTIIVYKAIITNNKFIVAD